MNLPAHEPAALGGGDPASRPSLERLAELLEIHGPFDAEAARAEAARCLQCPEAFCVAGCPLGNRIPEWLARTAEGQFLEAAALLQSANDLPEICAGPCPSEDFCQSACVLADRGEPVNIAAIARFLHERAFDPAARPPAAPPNGLRVAVLGSGPGGLACAEELVRLGYAVTVYDTWAVPAGFLANGGPALALEECLIQRRLEQLRQRGVTLVYGVRWGEEVTLAGLQEQFDAVFVNFGAQQARTLAVPGAELRGVCQALSFLLPHLTQPAPPLTPPEVAGRRVVVVGGGDTAMDCLRRALAAGAAAAVGVYRRDEAQLPAARREYAAALAAGATFHWQAQPVAFVGNPGGEVTSVRCVRTRPGPPDPDGRPRPEPVPGSEFEVPAEVVLLALGFDPVPHPLAGELAPLARGSDGRLRVDEHLMTSEPGVFAGGELVRASGPVVWEVRDGRRAAQGIHRYLFARRVSELAASETDHLAPG